MKGENNYEECQQKLGIINFLWIVKENFSLVLSIKVKKCREFQITCNNKIGFGD